MRLKEYVKHGKKIPFSINTVFHAGPIVKDRKIIAIGPTTSKRMDRFSDVLIPLGTRAIIGKGGMGEKTISLMKKQSCVYFAMTGGCAALFAKCIEEISNIYWNDLGMVESVWELKVKKMPLTVAIDTKGNSLYIK